MGIIIPTIPISIIKNGRVFLACTVAMLVYLFLNFLNLRKKKCLCRKVDLKPNSIHSYTQP